MLPCSFNFWVCWWSFSATIENFLLLSHSSDFMSVRFRIFYEKKKKSLGYFFPILINSPPGSGLPFQNLMSQTFQFRISLVFFFYFLARMLKKQFLDERFAVEPKGLKMLNPVFKLPRNNLAFVCKHAYILKHPDDHNWWSFVIKKDVAISGYCLLLKDSLFQAFASAL